MLVTAANTLVRVLLAPVCAACDDAARSSARRSGLRGLLARGAAPRAALLRALRRCPAVRRSRARGASAAGGGRRPFALARSAGRYDGSLRRIIHAFKYGGRRLLRAPLAALMREAGADLSRRRRRGRARAAASVARAAARLQPGGRPRAAPRPAGLAGRCAGVGTARRRPACPRRSGTPTCARLTRCALGVIVAGRPAQPPSQSRRRPGRRRDDDGRDAGCVQRGCCSTPGSGACAR